MSDERSKESEEFGERTRALPLLEQFDRLIASLPPGDPIRRELLDLRPDISGREEKIGRAHV